MHNHPTAKSMKSLMQFLKLIQVHDCEFTKVRVGNGNDGSYAVLHEICKITPVVYSFGIGEDISFEKDFKRRYPQAEIHLYDPYVGCLPEQCQGLNFHKNGIGHNYDAPPPIVQDSLLKMDIEGNEWSAFYTFELSELKKFSQIVCEFHIIDVPPRYDLTVFMTKLYNDNYFKINEWLFQSYAQVFELLLSWFTIVHIHANNSLPLACVNGYTFPPLLELTFLRNDLAQQFTPTKQTFPIPRLDVPNKLDRPDLHDYYPLI